jgi:YD repeat-containing protein
MTSTPRAIFLAVLLLLAGLTWQTSAHAQRYDYPVQGYQDTNNGGAAGMSPSEACENHVQQNPAFWKQPPNSYAVEQVSPVNWKCQLYTNGVIQPSYWRMVGALCAMNQMPIPPGAIWGFPHRDDSAGNCFCPGGRVFDANVQWCVASTPVCTGPNCTNPDKAKGDTCNTPGGGCAFANPIGPALGNKLERAVDYAGSPQVGRLYDGDGLSVLAVRSLFGRRWASEYDSRIEGTTPLANYFCRKRTDNGAIACATDLQAAPTSTSVSWRRGDGSKVTFELSGGSYAASADVAGRLERLAGSGGVTTGWRTITETDDVTNLYDAAGRLLSIEARDGKARRLSYSDGAGGILYNPASTVSPASPIGFTAPSCSIPHPAVSGGGSGPGGLVIPLGALLCVTDAFGKQMHLQYRNAGGMFEASGRLMTLVDPAGASYAYEYDGPSGGCVGGAGGGCNRSNLTRISYPDGHSRTYFYNELAQINGGSACPFSPSSGANLGGFPGLLTGIVDENGTRFASWTYNCMGLATSSEHAGGVDRYTVSYPGDRVGGATSTVVTDPRGSARTYAFQTVQGLPRNTGLTGPAGPQFGAAAQTFDANGNTASRTDWNGNRTNYAYDLARNLETSRTEGLTSGGATTPQTRTISTQWHATFRLPTAIAEPLRITTNTYDADGTACGARGALCSKSVQPTTDANGSQGFSATASGDPRVWTYLYNGNGSVLSVNGPRTDATDVTTYTYYPNNDADPGKRGNVETISNGLSHTTSITAYNAHGQPLTIVDPNGLTTTMVYDARLRLTSRTAGSEATSYTYDGVGQLTRVTLPDGSFLEYDYDDAHRLVAMNDNLGNRITYTLDAMGNRTAEQVRDPANILAQTRTREFNSLNRLFKEIGAQSQTTEYAYDNQGNVVSVKDPLNKVTGNQYDALNRLKQVTDPGLGVTQYGYNGLDALVSVSDPRSLVTGYAVDGLGNLTQQVSPDTGTTTNTYDAAGNLLTQTDAKGQATTYAYDALNRVTLITFHDGSKQQYAYDSGANSIGRLASITELDPANQQTYKTSYLYDQHGRALSINTEHAGVIYNVGYSYDSAGRLTSISYPSGRSVNYGFDGLGRVNQVTTTRNGETQAIVSQVAYQPFGGVKGFTFGNGQVYTRGIDLDGRIGSYTLGTQSFGIGYDAASRIEFIADLGNGVNTNTYGYDSLDRLTSAVTPGTPYAYTYDAVGNRTSKSAGSTELYTYSNTSNRIATVGTRSFSFDANGSTMADGNNTYAYDVRGRMVQATSSIGATSYKVNALGQRVRKTNSQADTVFHYDTNGRLIAESDPGGGVKRELIYLGDIPVFVWQ